LPGTSGYRTTTLRYLLSGSAKDTEQLVAELRKALYQLRFVQADSVQIIPSNGGLRLSVIIRGNYANDAETVLNTVVHVVKIIAPNITVAIDNRS
jgi:hypothetical protein